MWEVREKKKESKSINRVAMLMDDIKRTKARTSDRENYNNNNTTIFARSDDGQNNNNNSRL